MKRLLILFFLGTLLSCNQDATEIGSDFFRDGQLDISYIDSATVKFSTVPLAENATNSASRLLLGYHEDKELGKFSASVFFRASIETAVDLSETNSELQYAALHFEPDSYYFYDTLSVMTLSAYRVTEEIAMTNGYIYNTDYFQTGEKLGSLAFSTRPTRMDSLEIILNASFSEDLYARAKETDESLQTDEAFVKYLRGFSVQPEAASGSVMGFTPSAIELRLYYLDKTTTPAVLDFVSFPVKSSYSSNWITSDRSSTALEVLSELSSTERLNSGQTNDIAFVQGGTSLALRVDLPYLRNLKQLSNFFITRAVLDIWPVEDSFDPHTPLPASLIGIEVDDDNVRYNDVAYSLPLIEDLDLGRDTHYQVDVTAFVKTQMELAELNENGLLILFGSELSAYSANRIYLASPELNKKTKLRIYYATIND